MYVSANDHRAFPQTKVGRAVPDIAQTRTWDLRWLIVKIWVSSPRAVVSRLYKPEAARQKAAYVQYCDTIMVWS